MAKPRQPKGRSGAKVYCWIDDDVLEHLDEAVEREGAKSVGTVSRSDIIRHALLLYLATDGKKT